MKDGHLNKCSSCVILAVAEWRKKNPEARKLEHAKRRKKLGIRTRQEFHAFIAKTAKGRKVVSLEYFHRRKNKILLHKQTEEDKFVITEAIKLCKLREKILGTKWHIDHIVPINHKKACGLHVASNIQVVPAIWNVKKKNLNMDVWIATKAGY